MSLKLKNDKVTIIERGWADGTKQRNLLSKEDTSLPAVSTEGLMISRMIYAMEGRYVAAADITGEFLQTDYDKGDMHINM